jgi:hypothetical protein
LSALVNLSVAHPAHVFVIRATSDPVAYWMLKSHAARLSALIEPSGRPPDSRLKRELPMTPAVFWTIAPWVPSALAQKVENLRRGRLIALPGVGGHHLFT